MASWEWEPTCPCLRASLTLRSSSPSRTRSYPVFPQDPTPSVPSQVCSFFLSLCFHPQTLCTDSSKSDGISVHVGIQWLQPDRQDQKQALCGRTHSHLSPFQATHHPAVHLQRLLSGLVREGSSVLVGSEQGWMSRQRQGRGQSSTQEDLEAQVLQDRNHPLSLQRVCCR